MKQSSSPVAAPVVIAAGGLGTRVAGWSPYLPKEFQPVDGRPGLAHIMDEIGALGADRAVLVHHPYYTQLIAWTAHVLSPGALASYQKTARRPVDAPGLADRVRVDFLAQRGRYADITSVLEGAEHLHTGDFFAVFADNVDPTHTALPLLATAERPGVPMVLATPFAVAEASTHGVVVCEGDGPVQRMIDFVEKPSPAQVSCLTATYGAASLRLLQGRIRITPRLLEYLAYWTASSAEEPKLSLALASYARVWPVDVLTTAHSLADLGVPTGSTGSTAPHDARHGRLPRPRRRATPPPPDL